MARCTRSRSAWPSSRGHPMEQASARRRSSPDRGARSTRVAGLREAVPREQLGGGAQVAGRSTRSYSNSSPTPLRSVEPGAADRAAWSSRKRRPARASSVSPARTRITPSASSRPMTARAPSRRRSSIRTILSSVISSGAPLAMASSRSACSASRSSARRRARHVAQVDHVAAAPPGRRVDRRPAGSPPATSRRWWATRYSWLRPPRVTGRRSNTPGVRAASSGWMRSTNGRDTNSSAS